MCNDECVISYDGFEIKSDSDDNEREVIFMPHKLSLLEFFFKEVSVTWLAHLLTGSFSRHSAMLDMPSIADQCHMYILMS